METDDLGVIAEMDNAKKQSVLILCTGNSCRSQMAEVIWNSLGQEGWEAKSAGSSPAGFVHPLAINAMNELGLSTQELTSKSMELFQDCDIDLVVTVCDSAKAACPLLARARKALHWPFDDPAEAIGTDEQKMASFRTVRDQIQQKIADYLQQPRA